MVFGEIKTIIEENLINSYTDKKLFTETVVGFKTNFLRDKSLAKMYLIYDELTTPKGLNEDYAKSFLEEAVTQLRLLKEKAKLPITNVTIDNKYVDIDNIIYGDGIDINKIVESKKNIIDILMTQPKSTQQTINLPVSSILKIANQNIKEHIESMDEETRNDFLEIINEEESALKENFDKNKILVSEKLNALIESSEDSEILVKLNETLNKVQIDEYNKINFYKLKKLSESLDI